MIFAHFARAGLLLLLLLLLAKPGRSTLGTKEGEKTKTGSTSSVTLALTPPPPLKGPPANSWWGGGLVRVQT